MTPTILAYNGPTAYKYIPGGSTAGLTPTATTDEISHTPTTLWYSLGSPYTDKNGKVHADTIFIPQTPCPTDSAWFEYWGYCVYTPCPSGYWYDRTSCEQAGEEQLIVWFNGASATNGTLQATSSMFANRTSSIMVTSAMIGSSSPMITELMATTTATSTLVVVGSSGALSSQATGSATTTTTSSSSPTSFASSGSQSGSAAAATYTGAAVKVEYGSGVFGLILPGLLGYLL